MMAPMGYGRDSGQMLEIRAGGFGIVPGMIYRATARNRNSEFLKHISPAGKYVIMPTNAFNIEISSPAPSMIYAIDPSAHDMFSDHLQGRDNQMKVRTVVDALAESPHALLSTADKVYVKCRNFHGSTFEAQGVIAAWDVSLNFNGPDMVELEIQVDGEIREVRE